MSSSSASSPTALRWWFAVVMRRLREGTGVSRDAAAEAVKGSVSGIAHIEAGRALPKPLELDELLNLYGVAEQSENFQRLRKRARRGSDWWIGFHEDELPKGFDLFLGMESSASQIESWDAQVIPGLFQTADYAEAVYRGADPELPDAEVSRRVELRMARQREVMDSGEPPLVWRVLAETALRTQVGGPKIMRDQLEHLLNLAERPGIKLQVVAAAAGAHAGFAGAFTILSAPPELETYPGCVFVETLPKSLYFEQMTEIRMYRNALAELRLKAAAPAETPAVIHRLSQES